ncbi:unnamed protein product [Rotaria magnacalcarata]|uniref:Coiled-coil domain-containing protein 170 n=5 Tax=Rotaria magnacalcarata TaxID=392030 RepID=A0A819QTA8_9BILA|nr:unnamed protein product [Rotaria magnacalcarata]CAF1925990.1 unnamed protein product [Rotaria magnacalcarata]CAF2117557.1 unnamed protein product [Rotaria magnacalcarata]CAF4030440.1 unnamed protein product [Rotaria magnacalcarata]
MTSSSYMLERELLGSARTIIDAHSNTTLTQPPQQNTFRTSYGLSSQIPYTTTTSSYQIGYGGNGSTENFESKKALVDLQDQMRVLKKDLEKKDSLIQELTSMRDSNKHVHFESDRYDTFIGQDRASIEAIRHELDQYRLKVEGLNHELRELSIKSSAKDERINELKHEIESLKKEHDLVVHANNQLRLRARELESNIGSYDSVANKSSLTISSLQKDIKEKQDQILELQSRIRTHMEDRETSERKTDNLYKKLQELFSQLSVTLGTDYGQPTTATFDKVMSRVADINAENTLLKGKMIKIEEINRSLESECQSNRATLQQMSNQLNLFDHNNVNHRLQIDSMRAERDAALHDKETIKQELETVKSRLDSVQKAWQNTRSELDQRENRFTSHELHLKQLENDSLYNKSCLDAFKQQVSQLLSDGYVKVEPKEDEIKEKIHLLMQSSKDRGIIITNLQNQKEQLSKQLQEQIELNKETDKKRRHTESHVLELEQRVKTLDNNYTTTEVYRENLKQDKAKFLHFLERLAAIMRIENVSNELGYELNPDVILARAEQLMKVENDSIADQKSSMYNLQRKIKQLKEQMENKDLHLDLLKKKVIALEEGRTAKTDLEREIDDHVILSRKMKVKVEALTQQVNDLKNENTQLKAQSTDVHTLKGRLAEREKEIRRLLEDINKLEGTRDRQAVKISTLQDKIHSVDDDANRTLLSSDNAVRVLSNELRFLKSSLEQVTEREQRLIDFRALIARMLGLDAKTLAVPDYEITARLEHLLTIVQPAMGIPVVQMPVTTTTKPLSTSQQQQQKPPYHNGHYHTHSRQNTHSAHVRRRSPSPPSRRTDVNHRARSLSSLPAGIDPKTY